MTRRPWVLATLILAMFMSSIEGTIIATAMPDIVASLGGFAVYSWVFSSYLLMQAVMIPIFGKLADLFGRKPVFLVGVVIFLVGSILCGLAPTMGWLIVFRFIQGIGAGAVQPISMTLIGDLYTMEERARIQGYLASVWGISSIVGPLVGGLIVQFSHWAWIFWMNVPFGILAIIGISVFLKEEFERKKHSVDYAGAALFFLAVTSLMLILVQGGTAWAWTSAPVLALGVFSLLMFGLFLRQETRAAEPIMPLGLWRQRLIAVANTATLTAGMVLIGLTTFLPTFVQGVMGRNAVVAGFALTAMSLGWPLASTIAGRLLIRHGSVALSRFGGLMIFLGGLMFVLMRGSSGPWYAGAASFVVGVGMGFLNTTFIVSIQSSVGWEQRGVATASNMFTRIMGNALGAAVFGGLLNQVTLSYLQARDSSVSLDDLRLLLDAGASSLGGAGNELLQSALASGLHAVYWGVFIAGALTLGLALLMPEMAQRRAG
jgi:EmrB/QacA subfamily drug resistance transporter